MTLTNISVVKDLLSRRGFNFTKSLGQNFLINPSVCPRMAKDLTGGVLEIGAGVGVLTKELSKTAEKVVVIEIDKTLEAVLEETLADCKNIEIIWGDALKLDLRAVISEKFLSCGITEIDVCANLPYYVATNIILTLLELRLPIKTITVMVQEEVAGRLTASAGTKRYGSLSLAVRYYGDAKILFKVSRGSFIPAPNVDSAVVKIEVLGKPRINVKDEAKLFKLIKAAFSQRRKQLINPVSEAFGMEKEAVKQMLIDCGLKPTSRAEELTLEEYCQLTVNI